MQCTPCPASTLPMEALPFWCVKGPRESSAAALQRSRSRLPNDQLVRQRFELRLFRIGIVREHVHGPLGEILDRLTDRREGRPDISRHWRIVETGHGNGLGDVQSGTVKRKHRASRHVVVGASEGGNDHTLVQ